MKMKKKKKKNSGEFLDLPLLITGLSSPAPVVDVKENGEAVVTFESFGKRFYFRLPKETPSFRPWLDLEKKKVFLSVRGLTIKPFKVERV